MTSIKNMKSLSKHEITAKVYLQSNSTIWVEIEFTKQYCNWFTNNNALGSLDSHLKVQFMSHPFVYKMIVICMLKLAVRIFDYKCLKCVLKCSVSPSKTIINNS